MSSTVDAKKLQADESTNKKTDNSECTGTPIHQAASDIALFDRLQTILILKLNQLCT